MSRVLAVVALVAALVLTAQAEWTLAMAVGWSVYVAWAAPVTLDAYVVAAFRAGRDRGWALALMSAAVFAAHAAPVAFPGGFPWWLAGACSVVPPIVAWRVHELWLGDRPEPAAEAVAVSAPQPVLLPVEPVAVPEPASPPVAVTANPTATATAKPPKKATAKKTANGGPTANATANRDGSPAQKVAWLVAEMSGGRSSKELRLESGWSDRTWDRHLKAANDALAELAASDEREAVG